MQREAEEAKKRAEERAKELLDLQREIEDARLAGRATHAR
jgi:hypothetical protein